ncbi:quinone oxidoreductase [Fusarium falciforme]
MAHRPEQSRVWVVKNKPTGLPELSGDHPTFALEQANLPPLRKDQTLVKALYYSNDPAQRSWIDPSIPKERLYVPPVDAGEPMRARGLGQVVESTSAKVAVGSTVRGNVNWREYTILDADSVFVIEPPPGLSPTHYLGALGNTGLTAYYGLVIVSEARKSDRIVVSGAAGATGSMVVQIAKKIVGATHVIGIAGSDEKCRWVEELGADKCLNYKSPHFERDLYEATGAGVDLFYDNVGGSILDMMLARMSRHGRIAACGAISEYNTSNPCVLKHYFHIISMRLQIRGFILFDYPPAEALEVQNLLQQAIVDGKLSVSDGNETIVSTTFEDVPRTWLRLFDGNNTGKLVTRLVE